MSAVTNPPKLSSFTLILSGVSALTEELENALFEAGCDDALLGIQNGSVYLDFEREADSLRNAILTAIRQVETAPVGIHVIRVEPDDVVTAAEIARRTSRSRESIRLLSSGERGPGEFPPPVSSLMNQSSLWRWSEVAEWLVKNGLVDQSLSQNQSFGQNAVEIATLNSFLDLRRHVPTKKGILELWSSLNPTKKG